MVEVRTTAMAVGGEAVARDADGRVLFVAGALPGETVRVDVREERASFARGTTVDVLEAAPGRVAPPCHHVDEGCGGCDWQHADPATQQAMRLELVREVLHRAGGIAEPEVIGGPSVPSAGVRTTVRGMAGPEGRFAYRRRRSHDLVEVDSCLIAHPLVEELIEGGRFAPGDEVVIRVGARTGERMVVVGSTGPIVRVPDDVVVVGRDALARGHRAWLHEEAAGRRWRVSAGSFFQASPEGAEALVAVVGSIVTAHGPDEGHLVDLCCGVGLFAGTLGAGRRVTGVERSAATVADARSNLADRDARLVKVALRRWRPSAAEVVVADPARQGLGRDGVSAVAATGASTCVLVSCDPAALGRDAALLAGQGFEHLGSTVVDVFRTHQPRGGRVGVPVGHPSGYGTPVTNQPPPSTRDSSEPEAGSVELDMQGDLREASDGALVMAIGRYHQDALAEAYRRHAGAVFGLARRLLNDSALAEEIVQEVFLRLWNDPDKFDPGRGAFALVPAGPVPWPLRRPAPLGDEPAATRGERSPAHG